MRTDEAVTKAELAERFGKNLRHCRKRAGISQEELSVRAELHRTEIGVLECGQRMARLDTLVKLAGGLGIESSELLEGLYWRPGVISPGGFDNRDRS
jgi:transcriptional regulator with XRE-family HTH domain